MNTQNDRRLKLLSKSPDFGGTPSQATLFRITKKVSDNPINKMPEDRSMSV